MILSPWDDAARLRGHVSIRALLIQKYVLEGRGSGWLALWLGKSRWAVLAALKRNNIPLRGPRITILSSVERAHWEMELRKELEKRGVRSHSLLETK